jgi:hypothetical protein
VDKPLYLSGKASCCFREYLRLNPGAVAEGPSWLAVALGGRGSRRGQAHGGAVELALAEIERETLGAA